MKSALQVNAIIDDRLEQYKTIFNHKWVNSLQQRVDGTKLELPFFELSVNWRAAVNTHALPWMMMASMEGLWQGYLQDSGFTSKFVRAMAADIPRRMGGKMTNTARNRLAQVLKEFAEEIYKAWKEDPELQNMDANGMWRHFLESKDLWEFQFAIWGSQRFCFGALYHAYENYFREVLSIKKQDSDYRFRNYPQLLEHVTEEFGLDIATKCLEGEFLDIARWVRNALAHNGGKESKDLREFRKIKDHGIPVESGYLQITAPMNQALIGALEKRVTILTEEALKHPVFN